MYRNTIFRIQINPTSVKNFDTVSPGNPRFPPKQPEIGWKHWRFWKNIYSRFQKYRWKKYIFWVLVNSAGDCTITLIWTKRARNKNYTKRMVKTRSCITFFLKISPLFGSVLSTPFQLKRIIKGGLGIEPAAAKGHGGTRAKPPATGQFLCFSAKDICFCAIWITFRRFLEPHKKKITKLRKSFRITKLSSTFS